MSRPGSWLGCNELVQDCKNGEEETLLQENHRHPIGMDAMSSASECYRRRTTTMMKRIRVDDGRPAGTPTMGGEPKINTVDGDAPALVVEDDEHDDVAGVDAAGVVGAGGVVAVEGVSCTGGGGHLLGALDGCKNSRRNLQCTHIQVQPWAIMVYVA